MRNREMERHMEDGIRDRLRNVIDVARFFYLQQTMKGRLVLLALPALVMLGCALMVLVPFAPRDQRKLSSPPKSSSVSAESVPMETSYPIHSIDVTHTPRSAVTLVPTSTSRPTASAAPTNTATPTATPEPTDTSVPTATASPTVTATPTAERLYVPLILQD